MALSDNFFFFDSEHLDEVNSHFYGYCIAGQKDVDSLCADPTAYKKTYNGAYVLVQNLGGRVYISQDFIGSYGIYLFQSGGYFALSNSLLYMVEQLKGRFPLTPDSDVMEHLFLQTYSSASCAKTMIREIRMLPRWVSVVIDKTGRSLELYKKDTQEETLDIDSPAGMAALDDWYHTWTSFIRNLHSQAAGRIRVDLSGGMDSRMTFLLFLCSGVGLNTVRIDSIDDKLHTHAEDREIASAIAQRFGFTLNRPLDAKYYPLSLRDTIGLSFYTKLGSHKQMYFCTGYSQQPVFAFTGGGGEMLRVYEHFSKQEMLHHAVELQERMGLGYDFSAGMKGVLDDGEAQVHERFGPAEGKSFGHFFYKETQTRHHFGKAAVENYLAGRVTFPALLDINLHKIRQDVANGNLMVALLFTRYCPDLLGFKFDSGRSLDAETLARAKALNERFPFTDDPAKRRALADMNILMDGQRFSGVSPDAGSTALAAEAAAQGLGVDGRCQSNDPSLWCEEMFRTPFVRQQFCQILPHRVYDYALRYQETHSYVPRSEIYVGLAIARFVSAANDSRPADREAGVYSFFTHGRDIAWPQRWEDAFSMTQLRECLNIMGTARLDIKLFNDQLPKSDMKVSPSPDTKCTVRTPGWFAEGGVGYQIECSGGELELDVECLNDGKLQSWLKSCDIRRDGQRVPIRINYEVFTINGNPVLSQSQAFTRDDHFYYDVQVHRGDVLHIYIGWSLDNMTSEELTSVLGQLLHRDT